jgi:hypothetical protein
LYTTRPFQGKEEEFFTQLLFAIGITDSANASDTNKMLGFRLISNLFSSSSGQQLLHDQLPNVRTAMQRTPAHLCMC